MNEKDFSLVKNVAELAKLNVDDANVLTLAVEMKNMISFAALSNKSGGFAIMSQDTKIPLRADTAGDTLKREELLAASSGANDEFFIVPRVVSGGDNNE